jgi:hypothetical protein
VATDYVFEKKKAFKQLEDFNVDTTDEDKAYQEQCVHTSTLDT